MNENKKALYDLMENYFYDCEQNGYSDFETWCEDNIQNDEGRKINEYHVSANGSISEDEKTIYFYDEAYDSIRMITKQ